jgi:very-short-patch-repair endonuclease
MAAVQKLARRAARYVREGVDSAMETRLRLLLVLAGLPVPDVNVILRHPDGSWWMRFDPCYPSLKLIIEYDGRHHAEDSEQWLHDLKRREALDRMGWRVIVVTMHDYYDAPEEILHRVRDALIERGMVGVRRRSSQSGRATSSEPERFHECAAQRPIEAAASQSY